MGNPGHRAAWLDEKVNAASTNFFLNTLPTLDAAFVRPSYPGYLKFQDRAGDCIHSFLRDGETADKVLETLNATLSRIESELMSHLRADPIVFELNRVCGTGRMRRLRAQPLIQKAIRVNISR